MDLRLNDAGDLDLTEGAASLVDGVDRVRQQCLIRLKTFRGEWFLDTRVGMPYYQEILGVKPFSPTRVARRVRQALLGVPGVTDVPQVTTRFDGAARELTVEFQALAEVNGQPYVFSADFVLP